MNSLLLNFSSLHFSPLKKSLWWDQVLLLLDHSLESNWVGVSSLRLPHCVVNIKSSCSCSWTTLWSLFIEAALLCGEQALLLLDHCNWQIIISNFRVSSISKPCKNSFLPSCSPDSTVLPYRLIGYQTKHNIVDLICQNIAVKLYSW